VSASGFGAEAVSRPSPRVEPGPGTRKDRRGLFLTFEGIEGSGKTTQIAMLSERIGACGVPCLVTREPGGTPLGRALRKVLLDADGESIVPAAEMALYVADRAQHLVEVLEPALASGRVVLCDRYLDATLAYQGYGRGLDVDWIRSLHRNPPLDRRPIRTVLLDLEPEVALARARERNREFGMTVAEGRYESESLAFHERVRHGYLALAAAEPFRFRIVRAEAPADEIQARIVDLLSDLIPELEEQDVP
jgi:dTMP kinase